MFIVFLLSFLAIYGSMHLYLFMRARAAFNFDTKLGMLIVFFMFLMILAPILVRMLEKKEFDVLARILAYIGYTWMGFLFLFCSLAFVIDIYRLIVHTAGFIFKTNLSYIIPAAKYSFFIPCITALCISTYAYYEAKDIKVEKILIKSQKIPKEVGSIKMVQISDVHLGLEVGKERLEKIIQIIKGINPDILLSTGDLVDATIDSLDEFIRLLNELNPRYGKYAITGNHEFYAGINDAVDFTQKAGFKLLREETIIVGNILNLAGVDDPAGEMYNEFKNVSEQKLLSGFKNKHFTILLKHRPDVDKDSVPLFDLQLSGHTHKGQIFPFALIIRLFYPRYAGLWNLGGNSNLYVSRGTGTWGPLMRFMAPPEITQIEIISI